MTGAHNSPLPGILADRAQRAAWIKWRVRQHAKRQANAQRVVFKTRRAVA